MELSADLALDALFVFVAAVLVIFMQAGFGMLEAGLTRRKNASNIMMKNMMDFSAGVLSFFIIGYALAFGPDGNGIFGWGGFFLGSGAGDAAGDLPVPIFFLFQAAFAGTAATIVSGAVAERTKFTAYLIFSAVITAFIYPVVVHWAWNGDGWLFNLGENGFIDFAGSTVVHSVGAWAGLMGTIFLGARLGKYGRDGKPRAIPGHAIPLAVLGVFILWIGWYGFNPGTQLAISGENALAVGDIAVNTTLAAAAGAIVAMVTAWLRLGKPDTSMTGNGALAGLVAITAGCASVGYAGALTIGAIGGLVVVFSVLILDRVKVDDPVGAISVHGVAGAWGTLAVGFFAIDGVGLFSGGGVTQIGVQIVGIVAVFAWVVVCAGILFGILRATHGLRVSPEEEMEGLDVVEHGAPGYHDEDIAQVELANGNLDITSPAHRGDRVPS